MTTADLKTGDIVQHPEKGRGYVLRHGEGGSVRVIYASQARTLGFDLDLDTDGWERAEIVKPGHIQVRVDDLDLGTTAGRMSAIERLYEAFTPPQPDEPTEFGARVTITRPDGTREKWLRSEAGTSTYAWRVENGREFGRVVPTIWDNIIRRGTVSLGWSDES